MMRRFLAVLVVAIFTLAAACSSGGGKKDDKASDKTTTSKKKTTTTKDSGDSDDSGDSGDSGNPELDALLELQKDAVIKITYDQDGTTYTIAQDPPKVAYLFEDSGIYSDGESLVSCSGSGDGAQCMEMPGEQDLTGLLAGLMGPLAGALFGADITGATDTSEDEIVNRSATCVTWAPDFLGEDISGEVLTCWDNETGWVLKFEATGDTGDTSLLATEVVYPDDSDFEPPSEPMSLDDSLDDIPGINP